MVVPSSGESRTGATHQGHLPTPPDVVLGGYWVGDGGTGRAGVTGVGGRSDRSSGETGHDGVCTLPREIHP